MSTHPVSPTASNPAADAHTTVHVHARPGRLHRLCACAAASRRPWHLAASLTVAGLLLAGCGMKGPLYLPGPPPPADEELALPPDIPQGSNPTQRPLP